MHLLIATLAAFALTAAQPGPAWSTLKTYAGTVVQVDASARRVTTRNALGVVSVFEPPPSMPSSQLAGFAKKDDLAYFLKEICGIDYVHLPELAPTQELLDAYKKHGGDWSIYESQFLELMRQRRIEETVPRDVIADGCLLCSEDKPHHCHRRLVAEYLKEHWGDVEIAHLG